MNWLKKLGRWERVFLALAVLYAALAWLRPSSTLLVAPFLFVTGFVVAVRLIRRLVHNVLWRVRNRLMVSYLFIAVVPVTLLFILVLLGLYVLIGQIAIYAAYSELTHRLESEHRGLKELSRDYLEDLLPNLGDIILLPDKGTQSINALQDVRRHHVPPPLYGVDIEILWFSPIAVKSDEAVLVVRSRPSAILRSLFGQKVDWGAGFVASLAVVVSALLLAALLASVVVGVTITRRITGSVHGLYGGTLQVNAGNFAHRIPVRGNDQLAELSVAFNRMTENVERLIQVEKEKERLHSELEIAREVQSRLFPKVTPASRTLELTGVCHAANMVSGDYYDFLELAEGRLALAIGDVAGKGISAALIMAAIQSIMRAQLSACEHPTPIDIVTLLNRQIYASTSSEKYATFYFGMYDDATGELTYANCGHLPPLLLRNGQASSLEVTGTVVGAFPFVLYEQRTLKTEPGDLLVAYTDGIVEPEDAYGEQFGEQRLTDVLMKYQKSEAEEIIARTVEAVHQWSHAADQYDDMTMIVARRIG